jgi:hypothetical protein
MVGLIVLQNPESKRMRLSEPTESVGGEVSNTPEDYQEDTSTVMETVGPLHQRVMPAIANQSIDWNIRRKHVVPTNLPIRNLKCDDAWSSLTETQKYFLHYFERASWSGARICSSQISKVTWNVVYIRNFLARVACERQYVL